MLRMRYIGIMLILLVGSNTSGCALVDEQFVASRECGKFWCNERRDFGNRTPTKQEQIVARRGYIYALAATLSIQEGEKGRHHFKPPLRLVRQACAKTDFLSGFDACTYLLWDDPEGPASGKKPKELIVGFTGSNDTADWIVTNFIYSKRQFRLARNFFASSVKEYVERYPEIKIVVTGISLGGALAGHVARHRDTGQLVREAWLFNPSPKLGADPRDDERDDERFWMAAVDNEVLAKIRSRGWRWLPDINSLNVPDDQSCETYDLIDSTSIYGHYRWVLMRSLLFFADYAHASGIGPIDRRHSAEPLQIIKSSSNESCRPCR